MSLWEVFQGALAADFAFGGGGSCRLCHFGGEGGGGKEGKGFKVFKGVKGFKAFEGDRANRANRANKPFNYWGREDGLTGGGGEEGV